MMFLEAARKLRPGEAIEIRYAHRQPDRICEWEKWCLEPEFTAYAVDNPEYITEGYFCTIVDL